MFLYKEEESTPSGGLAPMGDTFQTPPIVEGGGALPRPPPVRRKLFF